MEHVSENIKGNNLRIKSPYFDIPRPNEVNVTSSLKIASNSLLTYLALADTYRNEDAIKNLEEKFLNTLVLCKSNEDTKYLNELLKNASLVGGYANYFYNNIKNMINEKGKEQALIFIQNNKNNNENINEKLENFKKEYARLEELFEKLRTTDFIEEQDLVYLLRKYNELQSILYTFNGEVDKIYISECDEQIEETINYLKNLYRTLDEVQNLDI